jgi:hypothetical protein
MQHLQEQRLKIAVDLMHTLDNIEQQSGIFLIKPMYSYKGRLVDFLFFMYFFYKVFLF